MIDILFISLGVILLLLGFIGCILPVIPGPVLALCGLVAVRGVAPHDRPSAMVLAVAAAAVLAVHVLDYIVPLIGARKFNCSRLGMFGCAVGSLVGLFFMPFGVILGPFAGAFSGELLARRSCPAALKGATGALLGYAAGMVLKLACCTAIAWLFIRAAF